MRSFACRQILVAAMVGWMALVAIPSPVGSAQENWIEQIAQHIREQSRLTTHPAAASAYERYLAQLQQVQQAFAQGNTRLVQREMGRLVVMVGTTENGIADSSAKLLLASIGEITPGEYLDSVTRSHLRLIREIDIAGAGIEEPSAPPPDVPYGVPVQTRQRTRSWTSWIFGWVDNGESNPLFALGAGVLLLMGVSAVVMAFIVLGVRAPRSEEPVQPKQAAIQVDEKKT